MLSRTCFPLIAEDRVGIAGDRAFGQISQKAVQLGAGVAGAGQAAAAEAGGAHAEITAVFLHDDIGGELGGAEQAVQARIDAHALVDAVRGERVLGADLKAPLLLDQRQEIGRVAIDLVGAGEDERRLRAVPARRFEQVQGAVGVDREIGLRVAGRPIVRRLGRGMDDRRDVVAVAGENLVHQRGVADVAVDVAIGLDLDFEPLPAPCACSPRCRRRRGACRCRCRRCRTPGRRKSAPIQPRSAPPTPSPAPRSCLYSATLVIPAPAPARRGGDRAIPGFRQGSSRPSGSGPSPSPAARGRYR